MSHAFNLFVFVMLKKKKSDQSLQAHIFLSQIHNEIWQTPANVEIFIVNKRVNAEL